MKCAKCQFPIYKGFETTFRGGYFHPQCAAEQAKIKDVPQAPQTKPKLKVVGEKNGRT